MEEDNISKYGEFICSYNHWLPLDEQKKQAQKMENITKSKKRKRR